MRTTRLTVKFPMASPKCKSYKRQREASHIKKNTDAKKIPNAGMRCDSSRKGERLLCRYYSRFVCLKFRQFRIGVFFLFGSFLAEESVAEISRISQALSNSSIFQLAREKVLEKKRKDLEDHQDLRGHKKEDHQDLRGHEKEDHQDLRSHTNGKIPKIARSPRSRRRPCFFSSNTSKSPFCAL